MPTISCWKILTRKKVLPDEDMHDSKLGRVLGTLDLAALGIGATLGVGVYVLAGHVSRDQAGPSVILSFLIAAAASFLAGLCYAEFGARVPRSGSAYIYSYVCIGEFIAFVIGWNLLLEYIIGSASVSKGLSLYIDTMVNDSLKSTFRRVAPMNWDFLSEYFDFFAFGIPLLLGVALAFGLRKSAILNMLFTLTNLFIVVFVIVAGSIKADIQNWQVDPAMVAPSPEENIGEGGFFPFGFAGTLKGAATCFFGYVGFDCIATTGEEVKDPRKAIPRAILLSLATIFLAYFGVSTVLTLMWPYYLQDVNAPLPHVFNEIGWPWAKWIVTIGGIFGLIASLFGAMFPLPRIIYAIAQDGLIFRVLGDVHAHFKTPVLGTLCAAVLTGSFAAFFDLKALVNMLSIGTLLAYTVVAISILILRFSNNLSPPLPVSDSNGNKTTSSDRTTTTETSSLTSNVEKVTMSGFFSQLLVFGRSPRPNVTSMAVVGTLVGIYVIAALGVDLMIFYAGQEIAHGHPWAVVLLTLFLLLAIVSLVLMSLQPREPEPNEFTVPLVPLLPAVSIFVNLFLMLMLDVYTWIRFGIWMAIGIPMYLICVCTRPRELVIPELKVNGLPLDQKTLSSISSTTMDSEPAKTEPEGSRMTPSASSKSLDEIVPESEVIDQLTEKKAGNGALYFTDEIREDSDETIAEDGETDTALAMLDDVLDKEDEQEENCLRKISVISVQQPPTIEAIRAVVHQEDEESQAGSSRPVSKQASIAEDEPTSLEPNLETHEELPEVPESEESVKSPESEEAEDFIEKLNRIYLERTLPNRKLDLDKIEKSSVGLEKTEPPDEAILDKKEPEVQAEIIDKAQEDSGDVKEPTDSIPMPPKFDPTLYHNPVSTDERKRSKSEPPPDLSKPLVPIVPFEEVSSIKPTSEPKSETQPESPEPDENNNRASIRARLEEIFRNGPLNRHSRTPTKAPEPPTPRIEPVPAAETTEPAEAVNSEESDFREKAKKFDTVDKQRLKFANVLKELNPNITPPTSRPTSSLDVREIFPSTAETRPLPDLTSNPA